MTENPGYSARLQQLGSLRWKRWLHVQAPYRWNVNRLCHGRVLDVGCGIGRNLAHLEHRAVGVDHNPTSVAIARQRCIQAFTPADFLSSPYAAPNAFDSMLVAHVLEHLAAAESEELLRTYLAFVRPGGRVVLITPQESGWKSDTTHTRWVGRNELRELVERLGLTEPRQFSFPFPLSFGRVFRYNEFVCVAKKPVLNLS